MRKSYLRLLGGVLFSLPLLFTSCGNGDNALEEIIKNGGTSSGGSGEGSGSSTISVTGITLDESLKVLVKDGDALTITATVTPSDATDKSVTWSSKNPNIATVENGVVTPVGLGITKITAKSGDKEATCEVFVGKVVNIGSSNYQVKDYDILIGALNSSNSITIPNNCKVAFAGVTTASSITCSGNATIILVDGSENTVSVGASNKPGIKIGGTGTTLTINAETEGTGILDVTGGNLGCAGIGTTGSSISNSAGGNITINGGKITAIGGNGGAGIGTGKVFHGSTNKCGKITINGGEVTATGGNNAAGIGTGYAEGEHSNITKNECGDITINSGTIKATGGNDAAGIGTGYAFKISAPGAAAPDQKCGAITIGTDVTSVTATKGTDSPYCIGVGHADLSSTQTCGVIKFGTLDVFNGSAWTTSMTDGNTYGGLNLAISGNDWTLTPVAP